MRIKGSPLVLAVRVAGQIVLGLVELCFWIIHVAHRLLVAGVDAARARAMLSTGVLRCPRGHDVPTSSDVYTCTACGFTYEGSIWVCANHECGATTPYVDCPTCGLSVRNPYRYGRPS